MEKEKREHTDPMSEQEMILTMLHGAMQAQKRSVRAYELMVGAAHSPGDKELLRTIRREERRHYYLLEGIYEDICGKAVRLPRGAVSMPRYYPDMLRTAICDKLEVIDHLEELDKHIRCLRQKDMLAIILGDQKEHARMLAVMYGRCRRRDCQRQSKGL